MYRAVTHFSGVSSGSLDVTAHLPWAYIIVATHQKVIYVGETFDQGGLISRLSAHFGMYPNSTLRQCAARHAGVRNVKPPFVVFAACLPFMEDEALFDGGSMLIRRKVEATLHEYVAMRFVSSRPGWVLVSSASPSTASLTTPIEVASDGIYKCFESGVAFLDDLTKTSPWNVVLLDHRPAPREESQFDVGQVLEETELQLFEWLIDKLKTEHGDRWWTEGVPEPIRVQCVTRRELEGENENMPAEAYLMLIDFKDIVRKNWALCANIIEEIADERGKDRATHWIVEVNEMRKLWAHPVKQRYRPVDATKLSRMKLLRTRITAALSRV